MKEITHKGQKCLIVYFIPKFNSKGKQQELEERVYLSHPFNYSVPAKEIIEKSKTIELA